MGSYAYKSYVALSPIFHGAHAKLSPLWAHFSQRASETAPILRSPMFFTIYLGDMGDIVALVKKVLNVKVQSILGHA